MRLISMLVGVALALAGSTAARSAEPLAGAPTPLAEAVKTFNAQAAEHPVGKTQPPLTEEEVVAGIRWAALHRKDLPVSEETLRGLRAVTETRQLPPGFEFEKLT